MSSDISDILAPLEPHWDRIVHRPLSTRDVDRLSEQIRRPIPTALREFLLHVGLFQDLTHWGASHIELYEDSSQFVSASEFLTNTLKPKGPALVPFGDDGSGNLFCLPTDESQPAAIHLVDHETGKVKKQKEFAVWLESVVKKVLKGVRKRPLNEHKVWAVQFCFSKTSFAELMKLLSAVTQVKQLDSDWKKASKSSAGVIESQRQIELNGQGIKMGRLEHKDWSHPLVSFDLREPVLTEPHESVIRNFCRLFKANCPDFRLVDYGPLDGSKF